MKATPIIALAIIIASTMVLAAAPSDGANGESYYYSQLDANGKAIYNELSNKGHYEPSFTVTVQLPGVVLFDFADAAEAYAKDVLTVALWAKYLSEPMFVHLWNLPVEAVAGTVTVSEGTVTVDEDIKTGFVATSVKFTLSVPSKLAEDLESRMKAVKTAAQSISNGVTGSNNAEMAKSIAKAITKDCKFTESMDADEGSVSNIYDCLVLGESGSRGFGQAFSLVCQLKGVEAITVNGSYFKDKTERIDSMWNAVECDGKWYDVDLINYKLGYGGTIMAGTTTNLTNNNSSRLHATVYVPERITGKSIDLMPHEIEREGYEFPDERPFYEKYSDYILLAGVAAIIIAFMAYAVRTGNIRIGY
ncbi:MAG: hypothetical protein II933_07565 [Candidatus Methanomethylophilaceae archaeon]|nr:hypothetical protein [Candidatus Methanomethylophilaceae archaeon]